MLCSKHIFSAAKNTLQEKKKGHKTFWFCFGKCSATKPGTHNTFRDRIYIYRYFSRNFYIFQGLSFISYEYCEKTATKLIRDCKNI